MEADDSGAHEHLAVSVLQDHRKSDVVGMFSVGQNWEISADLTFLWSPYKIPSAPLMMIAVHSSDWALPKPWAVVEA